jgi:hypothetical protein
MIEPRTEALRALYWREEILQVMFWIEGEGFGDELDAGYLERFLGVDAANGITYLRSLVDDGVLEQRNGRYRLTATGRQEGSRIFAEEFNELTQPSHGECGPTCWCRQSADEAEACASDRSLHARHDH